MSDGERQGYREATRRLQGRMIDHGMTAKDAEQKARDTAIRRDHDARTGNDKRTR